MSKTTGRSANTDFEFSVDTDVSHLPKPTDSEPFRGKEPAYKKPGPKVDPSVGKRNKMAATWLSEAELADFKAKLQGRGVSEVLREYILTFKG